MKRIFSLLASAVVIGPIVVAKEPAGARKTRSSVPGPYPSIIQIAPPGEPKPAVRSGLIQSELGGREMRFFQDANHASRAQLALAELAKGRSDSEQIKAVAETLASTQDTENREIARLAAERHLRLGDAAAKEIAEELAALVGAKFEKAWIERLITVCEESAAAYETGVKSEDAAIRAFAEKLLPMAQARLQLANRLGGRAVRTRPVTDARAGETPQPIPPPIAPGNR